MRRESPGVWPPTGRLRQAWGDRRTQQQFPSLDPLISLSLSLSISLSLYLSIYLSLSTYLSIYLSIYISVYLSIYLSLSIYIYLYLSLSLYIYIYICMYIYLYLSLSLSLYIYIYIYTSAPADATASAPQGETTSLTLLVQRMLSSSAANSMANAGDPRHDEQRIHMILDTAAPAPLSYRPVSLLRLSLLRFVDSQFSGNSLWAWEFHPLKLSFRLSKTL